jgi:hypothetical protein
MTNKKHTENVLIRISEDGQLKLERSKNSKDVNGTLMPKLTSEQNKRLKSKFKELLNNTSISVLVESDLINKDEASLENNSPRNYKLGMLVREILYYYLWLHGDFKYNMAEIVLNEFILITKKEYSKTILAEHLLIWDAKYSIESGLNYKNGSIIVSYEVENEKLTWSNDDKPNSEYTIEKGSLRRVINRQMKILLLEVIEGTEFDF